MSKLATQRSAIQLQALVGNTCIVSSTASSCVAEQGNRLTIKRHVLAGFACQECHGPVQTMDVVYQYSSLKMGWCVSCHRKHLNDPVNPASMDCLVCHH